jgi:hypothetical protein
MAMIEQRAQPATQQKPLTIDDALKMLASGKAAIGTADEPAAAKQRKPAALDLSANEELVKTVKGGIAAYFEKHHMDLPQGFDVKSGVFDAAAQEALGAVYTRAGVTVDGTIDQPLSGRVLDYRGMATLFPDKFGLEPLQQAYSSDRRHQFAEIDRNPEHRAAIAGVEQELKQRLIDKGMKKLARKIHADGSIKPAEREAVNAVQALEHNGKSDGLTGAGTLEDLMKLQAAREKGLEDAYREAQQNARLGSAETRIDSAEKRISAAEERLNLHDEKITNLMGRMETQEKKLQALEDYVANHIRNSNYHEVLNPARLRDENYLKKAIAGLLAYESVMGREFSTKEYRDTLRTVKKSEKEGFESEYAKFVTEFNLSEKEAKTAFLQQRLVQVLEGIRAKAGARADLSDPAAAAFNVNMQQVIKESGKDAFLFMNRPNLSLEKMHKAEAAK